jgi:2C-methyl-D-erythritol 2,4-cyclodiphosphate synthase
MQREALMQEMQRDVLISVDIQHPIICDRYNLCDLVSDSENKLDKLKIVILQDICSSLQIDTSDIKVKRKKPYIDLIVSVVSKCSCQCKP